MMRIKLIIIVLCLLVVSSIQATTIKIATAAPDGSFWMKQMRTGAMKIKKLTQNRVKFKFYPGGVMGSEEVVLKKMRVNQLQGAALTYGSLEGFYADSQVYALPMIFNTFEEVDYIRSIYDKKIINGLENAGLVSFGLSEAGFTYAMSTSKITRVEDLKKHKIWTPVNNKQAEISLVSFDITPIPLSIGDVLAGLQTNLIDTVAISPIAAIALQWHTQIKYVTDIPLTYVYATLVIDKNIFNKINISDQKIVKDIMQKIFKRIDKQNRKDNVSAFLALENQGIEVISPDGKTLDIWCDKGESARKKIKSIGELSDTAYDEISQLIKNFRQSKETANAVGKN